MRVFVIHQHRASTRVSFALRLEVDGTLKSWAVPKEPSYDPTVKRMAVRIEDRPVEDIDFEEVIPDGATTIVWDRGTYTALEPIEAGLENGKLLFELEGYKLSGVWTLVRTKRGKNEWLLIKHAPHVPGEETKTVGQESVLSGLRAEIVVELEKLGAPKKKVRPPDQQVMLAETSDEPFSRPGWIYELKYDGFRLLTAREHGEAQMFYRRGANATKTFPDLARALSVFPFADGIIDGEVVVLDEESRPSFQRLQRRVQLIRTPDIERAAALYPATVYAFDLLAFEGYDLRPLPLVERKRILKMILPKGGVFRFSDHISERGVEFFKEVEKLRLEGIVAKKANSPYRAGRSPDWRKVRVDHTGDFVIVGYTLAEGSRSGFGALHLALWDGDRLVYVGRAGSGFSEKQLRAFSKELEQKLIPEPAFGGNIPKGGGQHFWVQPERVCEVRYKEITEDGLLRQPVFMRMRDDKPMHECVLDASFHRRTPDTEEERPPPEVSDDDRAIAPWRDPYLEDRVSEGSLVSSSRISDADHPDWCFLELDGRKAPLSSLVEVARAVRALCEEIELPSFVKTGGSHGLHVLLPLGRQLTYDQSRSLGELIAKVIAEELPKLATTTRGGAKVYVDYLQNAPDKLVLAPYSVSGTFVSMPLEWSEVGDPLDSFTTKTALERMARLRDDPLLPVLELKPSFGIVLAKLSKRLRP